MHTLLNIAITSHPSYHRNKKSKCLVVARIETSVYRLHFIFFVVAFFTLFGVRFFPSPLITANFFFLFCVSVCIGIVHWIVNSKRIESKWLRTKKMKTCHIALQDNRCSKSGWSVSFHHHRCFFLWLIHSREKFLFLKRRISFHY